MFRDTLLIFVPIDASLKAAHSGIAETKIPLGQVGRFGEKRRNSALKFRVHMHFRSPQRP